MRAKGVFVARVKAASFDERMTLVSHLDELRSRIIYSLIAFGAAFALCFWQDTTMLEIANRSLPNDQPPLTLSPTEPFFTTMTVAAYGAMVISLPFLLFQAYSFVLPAFSPKEKKVVFPFLVSVPFLFLAGVAFAYFIVMPAAVQFLLNFNDSEFNIQVRAKEYYGFLGLTMIAMGLLFQIPIGVLSLTRLEIVTPDQLATNRKYVIFGISIVAAALPGGDPVSMFLIMIPLIFLYEGSIILARRFGHSRVSDDDDDPDDGDDPPDAPEPDDPPPAPAPPVEPDAPDPIAAADKEEPVEAVAATVLPTKEQEQAVTAVAPVDATAGDEAAEPSLDLDLDDDPDQIDVEGDPDVLADLDPDQVSDDPHELEAAEGDEISPAAGDDSQAQPRPQSAPNTAR